MLTWKIYPRYQWTSCNNIWNQFCKNWAHCSFQDSLGWVLKYKKKTDCDKFESWEKNSLSLFGFFSPEPPLSTRYNNHQKVYSIMVSLIWWCHFCRDHFHSFESLTSTSICYFHESDWFHARAVGQASFRKLWFCKHDCFPKSDCFISLWSQLSFGDRCFLVLVGRINNHAYEISFPKLAWLTAHMKSIRLQEIVTL